MARTVALCLVVLATTVVLPAQRTTLIRVDAQVVDEAGRPVAGVEFADRWGFADGRWRGSIVCQPEGADGPLTSDADGRLAGTWIEDPMATPLLGLSADRGLAAFAPSRFDAATHEPVLTGRITMRRVVTLRGRARTVLGHAPGRLHLFLNLAGEPRRGMPFGHEAPTFELPLPPGTYSLAVGCGHAMSPVRTVVLAADQRAFDLGPVSVPMRPFDLLGEVLPDWEVARAENVAVADADLADFRGRPLLVCFAEFGWKLRLAGADRADLAALAEHPRRDDFGVVLFDTSVLEPWPPAPPDGEPPVERMFPLIAAEDGTVIERLYGSRWAVVVLDRDGRLVHRSRDVVSAVAALERALGGSGGRR